MLKSSYFETPVIEAGCDEAGRGCLAGPVFAAAVVLPFGYSNPLLNDSKKLSPARRNELRKIIEKEALYWSVSQVSAEEIDKINILNASICAMQIAVGNLGATPEILLIDGNRFKPYAGIPYKCIVKGDGIYMSIAAASILAKTHRDEFMLQLHSKYPQYGWAKNMGYPTADHRKAIHTHGIAPWHRRSFRMSEQMKLNLR